jgi:hypothetical protein
MAPPNRTKCKTKGGLAAATKPNNPATVNPAAANNSVVATAGASKCSHMEPAHVTTNNSTEPNPPATVAVHPATANGVDVPSRGGMATTVGGSDSIKYDDSTLLSLLLPPQPVATKAPPLSLNLLDSKISTSNTTVNGEITRIVKHAAKITSQMDTTMVTAISAGGTTTNPLPPDSDTPQKRNNTPSNTKTQTVSTK